MFWRRPGSRPGEVGPADGAAVGTGPGAAAEPPAPGVSEPTAPTDATAASTAPDASDAASLAAGVERSRRGFAARLQTVLHRGADDEETWEEVEETLIGADVGAALTTELVARARRRTDGMGPAEAIREELASTFAPREATPWPRKPAPDVPAVILVVGVNGTGKTTTIAKLAARFSRRGARVLLAAADTFRAAAIEQLEEWAERVGVPVVAHAAGADPSAVVYDALDAAVARGLDLVIVDTAGRLHTKHNLMAELAKIRRTIAKRVPGAEPEVVFVLDATTGQNGLAQARAFHDATGLTGIVLTKLDSTAKGGIVFAIERTLGVPVLFVGTGERLEDLVEFDPPAFLEALFA